jgi:hypothetical protein
LALAIAEPLIVVAVGELGRVPDADAARTWAERTAERVKQGSRET